MVSFNDNADEMKKVFSNPRNVFLEEGRCDGVLCRYCIFGKKQQCYSSWLKRISDFDEAHRSRFDHKHDELVVYICRTFFRVKSRRVRQRQSPRACIIIELSATELQQIISS